MFFVITHNDQLCQQLKDAGFAEVKTKRLMPFESFWAFIAIKPL